MGHLVISVIAIVMVLISQPCASQGWPTSRYKIDEIDRKTGDKADLYSYLERTIVRSKNNKCSTNWQVFYFRVNSKGKVDSLHHEGTLEKNVIGEITKNIYSTNGHWRVPKSAKPSEKYWFVYPYFDFGTHFYLDSDCPESDRILQKNMIESSEQFSHLCSMNSGGSPYVLRPFRVGGGFDLE